MRITLIEQEGIIVAEAEVVDNPCLVLAEIERWLRQRMPFGRPLVRAGWEISEDRMVSLWHGGVTGRIHGPVMSRRSSGLVFIDGFGFYEVSGVVDMDDMKFLAALKMLFGGTKYRQVEFDIELPSGGGCGNCLFSLGDRCSVGEPFGTVDCTTFVQGEAVTKPDRPNDDGPDGDPDSARE